MLRRPRKRPTKATTNGIVKIPKLCYSTCSLTENAICVPVDNYPIYKYSRRYANRFSRLSGKLISQSNKRKSIYDEDDTTCVKLTFLKNKRSSLDVEELVISSLTKKPSQSVTGKCNCPFDILVSSYNVKKDVSNYLTDCKQNGHTKYILFIDESKSDVLYTPNRDGKDIRLCVVGPGKIREGIGRLLERHVFQEIKDDAAMLQEESRQRAKGHSGENERLIAIKELLCQMKSAYARSSVPVWEQPTFEKTQMQLDNAVARDLAKIEGVIMYGYIFDILNVFVNGSIGQRDARQTHRDLQRLGIKEYVVRFVTNGFEHLSCKVGSIIENQIGKGTLGGFADRTDGDGNVSLCAMTAEHCVQPNIHASNKEYNVFTHDNQIIGRTLVPRKQTLDITAIEITDEPKIDDTYFKTFDGQPSTSCQLIENIYSNREETSGRLVYICGEQSAPGKGVIVSNEILRPDVPAKDLDSYVLIEDDEDSENKFALKGDCGAIVCEEDISGQLNVISMVEGRWTTLRSTSGINDRTIYRTINLKAGLDQLSDQYQSTFRLRGQQ